MPSSRFQRFPVIAGIALGLLALCTRCALAQADTAKGDALQSAPRKSPAYILIKVDDLRDFKGKVHPRWQKLVDFLKDRKIKAGIGIICNSLEKDNPEYIRWIKEQWATGRIEFWNHGYDHREWMEDGKKRQEFVGTSYEQQKEHLTLANRLAKEKLGFTLPAFGAPFNGTDAATRKALEEDPDTKIWLYGDMKNPAGKLVLDRVGSVNIENPSFKPSLEKFIDGYRRYGLRAVR
jgi:peptidoglycan/xylan/chitin deacetylase (PgdA/CDA1 family)